MITAYALKHINPGDFVIFDNASVHSAASMQLLDDFFSELGIHLVRTPTYSPELNAIEKLFGFLKNKIYRGKARDMKMETFLQREIPLVPQENILEWTRNCVFHINFQ
jgi:transposase